MNISYDKEMKKLGIIDETMEAIITAACYNGLCFNVARWQYDYLKMIENCTDKRIFTDEKASYMGMPSNVGLDRSQLQFIWMIMVERYGSYNSSPRVGWIKNIDDFIKTCLKFEAVEFSRMYISYEYESNVPNSEKAELVGNHIDKLYEDDEKDDQKRVSTTRTLFLTDYYIYKCIFEEEADNDYSKAEELFVEQMYGEFCKERIRRLEKLKKKFDNWEEE